MQTTANYTSTKLFCHDIEDIDSATHHQ